MNFSKLKASQMKTSLNKDQATVERRLTGRASRRFVVAALACAAALLTSLGAVHASYFNPTSPADCNIWSDRYAFAGRKASLNRNIQQCLKTASGSNWIRIPACGYGGSRDCAALEQQRCELEREASNLRQSCMAKLQIYKQEEARRRAEEEAVRLAAEQAQREANRFNMQSGRLATGDVRDEIKSQGNMIKYFRRGGKLFAKGAGIPTDQMGGAYHLSEAVSGVALRYLQGTGENSLRALEDAMKQAASRENYAQGLALNDQILQMRDSAAQAASSGPYSRDNPMPTQAESDRMREEIMGRTVETALLEGDLPFGGESAVEGENARHLTAIAQARAGGRLDTPLSEINAREAAATVQQQQRSNIKLGARNSALRQHRVAALEEVRTSITEQKRRIAAAEAQRKRQLAEAERRRQLQAERRQLEAARVEREKQRIIAAQNAAKIRDLQRRMRERQERIEQQQRLAEEEKRRRSWANFNSFMNGLFGAAGAVGSAYINNQQGRPNTYRGRRQKCGSVAHGTVC